MPVGFPLSILKTGLKHSNEIMEELLLLLLSFFFYFYDNSKDEISLI